MIRSWPPLNSRFRYCSLIQLFGSVEGSCLINTSELMKIITLISRYKIMHTMAFAWLDFEAMRRQLLQVIDSTAF